MQGEIGEPATDTESGRPEESSLEEELKKISSDLDELRTSILSESQSETAWRQDSSCRIAAVGDLRSEET